MYKRMRKFGFTNKAHKIEYAPLNLSRLQFWIDTGRIDATQMITMKTLVDSGCVGRLRKLQRGVKLLGDVRTPHPISLLLKSYSIATLHLDPHSWRMTDQSDFFRAALSTGT